MRLQAGKILAVMIFLSSLAIASSYLMSGLLNVEGIENITVEIDYFSHWNATVVSQGKTISWSGFGKNVKSILGVISDGGDITLRVQKDSTNYAMFVWVRQGERIIHQGVTSKPNGVVEINFSLFQ